MTDVQYLIVGSGMAGITAAQEIRHADAEARILIVSDEKEPYYYRASLSEWMARETTDEMLPGRTPAFYEQMRLEQIADRVTRVDAAAREVILASGVSIRYRKLLLATGATGLLLLAFRETRAMGSLLALHLGGVMALFVTLPYGKFVHAVYRFAALLRFHVERRQPPVQIASE